MYRRIEICRHGLTETEWSGCSSFCTKDLRAPNPKQIKKNTKFYFTEKGWNKFGREILKKVVHSIKNKDHHLYTHYRVISIKENSLDIHYKDAHQVCGKKLK